VTRLYTWYSNLSSETVTAILRTRRFLTLGQGLAEYALILALIAIVAIIALIFLGGQVSKILSQVGHSV
jgi:Flp pilus assembly pilin Flp